MNGMNADKRDEIHVLETERIIGCAFAVLNHPELQTLQTRVPQSNSLIVVIFLFQSLLSASIPFICG